MKEKYREVTFHKESKVILAQLLDIVDEYATQEIKLTLRQLYYQLVARGFIENKEREYKKISRILKRARYGGVVDWESIEDRSRTPKIPYHFESIPDFIKRMMYSFKRDRWDGQDYYLELMTEKDALSSVLSPIVHEKYHMGFNVVHGYSSITSIYDMSKRFMEALNAGKKGVLLYVGDHDPSGLDMVRDVRGRLSELLRYVPVDVIPVALTMDQIHEFNPPPNPAKITDSRAKSYIEQYGAASWEVDALRPDVLIRFVEEAILGYLDVGIMNEVVKREQKQVEELRYIAENFDAIFAALSPELNPSLGEQYDPKTGKEFSGDDQ